MNFGFSDEQTLVQKTARDFAALLRGDARRAEEGGPDPSIVERYRALSLDTLDWPEARGGLGLGALDKVLVLEELAAGCAGCTMALERRALASEDGDVFYDADARLTRDGGTIAYFAARSVESVAVVHGDRLWVFDRVSSTPVRPCALHAAGACEITLVGPPRIDRQFAEWRQLVSRLRLHAAACLVGVARASHEHALGYALEREAFGRKIAHHQAIAFLLADMRIRLDAARMLLHAAALGVDSEDGFVEAAGALVESAAMALFVTDLGVQLLGAHGYVKDHPVEKYYREARTLALLYGGADAAAIDLEECE